MNPDQSHIKGVEYQSEGNNAALLEADLIVDASGAGFKTSSWLKELGYSAPEKTEVKVNLVYASRIYRTLSSKNKNWSSLLVYPNPPVKNRGGSISPIENQRWMVTLLGYGADSPPSSEDGFLAFAKSLEEPNLYEAIKMGQPETDVSIYRFPALRRCHYEKLHRFPNGLIVMGDAFCRIDPVFAQGMSLSALEASALKKELQKAVRHNGLQHISMNAHRRFSKIVSIPWLIALTEDFRFTHTVGKQPFGLPFLKWYIKRAIVACSTNQAVYGKLINVLQLKAHPVTLFTPSAIAAVLFQKGVK